MPSLTHRALALAVLVLALSFVAAAPVDEAAFEKAAGAIRCDCGCHPQSVKDCACGRAAEMRDEVRGLATRVPGLGDVPVLGSLFRSVEYRRQVTELVILVTPELVAPLNPGQVPMVPGEDHIEPNDWELYALGVLEGEVPVESEEVHYNAEHDQAMVESEPELTTVHGPWGHATEED